MANYRVATTTLHDRKRSKIMWQNANNDKPRYLKNIYMKCEQTYFSVYIKYSEFISYFEEWPKIFSILFNALCYEFMIRLIRIFVEWNWTIPQPK